MNCHLINQTIDLHFNYLRYCVMNLDNYLICIMIFLNFSSFNFISTLLKSNLYYNILIILKLVNCFSNHFLLIKFMRIINELQIIKIYLNSYKKN